jgi:hypothetical protein
MTNLNLNSLINITLNLQSAATSGTNFQSMLVLGSSAVIDSVERYRQYTDLTSVGADFGNTTPEYLAAQAWFAQKPTPNSLTIGRWFKTASAGQLICGALTTANKAIATWQAVTAGAFDVSINGTLKHITSLNFSTDGNLNAVATRIQNALAVAVTGTTCIYDSIYSRFVITSPSTGVNSTISVLSSPSGGTDISGMLSGTTVLGAYAANGFAAQSALDCVTYFDQNYGSLFFGLYVCEALAADYDAIAAYIEGLGGSHVHWTPTQDTNTLSAVDTTNLAYLFKLAKYKWSPILYSSTSLYAVISLAARIMTVDWTQSNSAITLMWKTLPGITAETLTPTQAAALKGFNCNVYTNYNIGSASGTPIVQYGICPSGDYIDSVIGAAVLASTIQTNFFNTLYTSNKVSQSDQGQGALEGGILKALEQFVDNNYIAPGTWQGASFGQVANGDYMASGYYVYQPPVSSQSDADRSNRISVPFQVAANLSGAIHQASVQINLAI